MKIKISYEFEGEDINSIFANASGFIYPFIHLMLLSAQNGKSQEVLEFFMQYPVNEKNPDVSFSMKVEQG